MSIEIPSPLRCAALKSSAFPSNNMASENQISALNKCATGESLKWNVVESKSAACWQVAEEMAMAILPGHR